MDDTLTVTVTPAAPGVHLQHGAIITSVEVPTPPLATLWEAEKAGAAGLVVEVLCRVRLVNGFVLHQTDEVARASQVGPTVTGPEMAAGIKAAED